MGAQQSKHTPLLVPSKPVQQDESTQEKAFLALSAADTADTARSAAKGKVFGDALSESYLKDWSRDFEESPTLPLSRLVLSKSDPLQVLAKRKAVSHDEKVFNLQLKGLGAKGEYPGPRVNQKVSGRCWLFATTNVLRYNVMEKLNLGDFELSQSYLFFYDKLEKANYYLENILETRDEALDSRLVSYLNQAPVQDGGQWDMALNLIEKYGIIPQTLYPESYSSSASSRMDQILTSKLREYALRLRATPDRRLKGQFMNEVYNTLCITLDTPARPDEQIKWEYYDRDNKFHSWTGTPRDFYEQFGKRKGMDPGESFSLVNDPRNGYGKLYTVNRLGNVWGGKPIRYVNAPAVALEDAVIAGIKANTPLFFGCDSSKSMSYAFGIFDTDLFDVQAAFGFKYNLSKADRLRTGESVMTHAMVITAAHLDDKGRPLKYKVENSWSDAAGEKGWFMMTAEWFRENVFQVVVPRSVADKKWVEVLDKGEPVVLDAWDPMGALA